MTRCVETSVLLIPSSFPFDDLRLPLGSMRLPRSQNMRADILKVEEQCEVQFRFLIEGCFNELKKKNFKPLQNRQCLFLVLIILQSFISWAFFECTVLMNWCYEFNGSGKNETTTAFHNIISFSEYINRRNEASGKILARMTVLWCEIRNQNTTNII